MTESSQTTEGSGRTLDMNEDKNFPLLTPVALHPGVQ